MSDYERPKENPEVGALSIKLPVPLSLSFFKTKKVFSSLLRIHKYTLVDEEEVTATAVDL